VPVLDEHPSLQLGVWASVEQPQTRFLEFSGYSWLVKSGAQIGPGPNNFSESPESVWVDPEGLHLRTRWEGGLWYAAEVVLPSSLGYGDYEFTVSSPVNALDVNAVFAGFIYKSDVEELDIEFSRGLASPFSAQFAVQPWYLADHLHRFDIPASTPTHHRISWLPGRVQFVSWAGESTTPDATTTIEAWCYDGPDVPIPGGEHMRFNLWLIGGQAPISGTEDEVVVRSFEYRTPGVPDCPGGIVGNQNLPPVVSIAGLNATSTEVHGTANNIDATSTRVVVYAKTTHWFVQPFATSPYTEICSDGSWSTATNQGERFVALLVKSDYIANPILISHPSSTPGVLAWDEFPEGCNKIGIVGNLTLPPQIEIVGLQPGASVVSGTATNVDADVTRIVLYALTDKWHSQPHYLDPFTSICSGGAWQNTTHTWNRVVALLVYDNFVPIGTSQIHPATQPGVLAWDEYPSKCLETGFIGEFFAPPSIEISLAQAAHVEGTASNIHTGTVRVLLWALTNKWYVQPYISSPFTSICLDGTWQNFTHPWDSIVALLVDETYQPPSTQTTHPSSAQGVIAYDQVWR
jgi:hypothetical protein